MHWQNEHQHEHEHENEHWELVVFCSLSRTGSLAVGCLAGTVCMYETKHGIIVLLYYC